MHDLRRTLRSHLSDHYTIVRKRGAGGMTTVHLAIATRNDRRVALTLLRPEAGDAVGAQRFPSIPRSSSWGSPGGSWMTPVSP